MRAFQSMLARSFPLGLPAVGCVLGLQTLSSPWLVLAVGLVVVGVVWWMMVRMMVGTACVDVSRVAAVGLSVLGGVYAYMAGLVISREGGLPLAACLIAFSAGLIAGLMERRRAVRAARLARELRAHGPGEGVAVAALAVGVR